MKNYKTLALGSVLALAFAATSALAVPPAGGLGPGPVVDECPYGFDRVGAGPHHRLYRQAGPDARVIRHGRHVQHYLFLKDFIANEKFSKDAHVLVTMSDTIYAEKQVLDGLKRASSTDATAIRKQAMSIRNLERKLAELEIAFYDRVINEEPALLEGINCPYLQERIAAAKSAAPAEPEVKK